MKSKAIQAFLHTTFRKEHTTDSPLMTKSEIDQLTWSIREQGHSSEKAIEFKGSYNLFEVKRASSRFFCLDLLTKGGDAAYQEFIDCQEKEDVNSPVLTKVSFESLSANFKTLDPLTLEALKISTVVSSVTMSPAARERADAVMGKNKYPFDSVEFLAATFKNIEHAKAIYPLVEDLYKRYPAPQDQERLTTLLQSAFSSARHYRHMLYTEGNANMFRALSNSVKTQTLDKEAYEFWKLHWTINITGFRGQLKQRGSVYLTQNTYDAMKALEAQTDKLFTDPDVTPEQILDAYLESRAQMLGLDRFALLPQERKILAHLGALMRMYVPLQGKYLAVATEFFEKGTLELESQAYFDTTDKQKPTPTYIPAFFQNAKDRLKELLENDVLFGIIKMLSHKDKSVSSKAEVPVDLDSAMVRELISNTMMLVSCLPLYLRSLKEFDATRTKSAEISHEVPLSFKFAAGADSIKALFQAIQSREHWDLSASFRPVISSEGALSFVPLKLDLGESKKNQQEASSSSTTLTFSRASKPMQRKSKLEIRKDDLPPQEGPPARNTRSRKTVG